MSANLTTTMKQPLVRCVKKFRPSNYSYSFLQCLISLNLFVEFRIVNHCSQYLRPFFHWFYGGMLDIVCIIGTECIHLLTVIIVSFSRLIKYKRDIGKIWHQSAFFVSTQHLCSFNLCKNKQPSLPADLFVLQLSTRIRDFFTETLP